MKELLKKAMDVIETNNHAKLMYQYRTGKYPLCYKGIANAAANKLFDDHYEDFGMTEEQGIQLGSFFRAAALRKEAEELTVALLALR